MIANPTNSTVSARLAVLAVLAILAGCVSPAADGYLSEAPGERLSWPCYAARPYDQLSARDVAVLTEDMTRGEKIERIAWTDKKPKEAYEEALSMAKIGRPLGRFLAASMALGYPAEISGNQTFIVDTFSEMAHQGCPIAMLMFSHLYAKGYGVDWNVVQAYKWALLAEHGGAPGAAKYREALANDLPLVEQDYGRREAAKFKVAR